jgi:hypothetical protein
MARSEYWRIREEEYRAIAASCSTASGREGWLALAEVCAVHADMIEEELVPRRDHASFLLPAPANKP